MTRKNEDSTKVYTEINRLWDVVITKPDYEKYIYKGPIFIALIIDQDIINTISDEEIIKEFKNWPLGIISEYDAISIAKMQKRTQHSFDNKEYYSCILNGNTDAGINISKILKNFPNEKCIVDYINTMRDSDDILVLLKPDSTDLYVYLRERK